jgi:hypothetical protein
MAEQLTMKVAVKEIARGSCLPPSPFPPITNVATTKYTTFTDELSATKFASGQDSPMKLRVDLLESFMKRCEYTSQILVNTEDDFLADTPGSLTIVDLTDPVINTNSA